MDNDPDAYEEMLHKRKWKSVNKNPSTAIKDINGNKSAKILGAIKLTNQK